MPARGVSTDFLQSMRFWVELEGAPGGQTGGRLIGPNSQAPAGFATCSTPELSSEAVEYKEGNYIYARKFPGNPTVSDITMTRGCVRLDSSMWSWMKQTVEGGAPPEGEYRENLNILHFHRDTSFAAPTSSTENKTKLDITAKPGRIYHVFEAFPIRCKAASDLDATASEVSVQELDVAYESFVIEEQSAS